MLNFSSVGNAVWHSVSMTFMNTRLRTYVNRCLRAWNVVNIVLRMFNQMIRPGLLMLEHANTSDVIFHFLEELKIYTSYELFIVRRITIGRNLLKVNVMPPKIK